MSIHLLWWRCVRVLYALSHYYNGATHTHTHTHLQPHNNSELHLHTSYSIFHCLFLLITHRRVARSHSGTHKNRQHAKIHIVKICYSMPFANEWGCVCVCSYHRKTWDSRSGSGVLPPRHTHTRLIWWKSKNMTRLINYSSSIKCLFQFILTTPKKYKMK